MQAAEAYEHLCHRLEEIYDKREANNIARILMEDVFEFTFPFKEVEVPNDQLEGYISRLLSKEPVQYIIGEADFYGFRFKVNSNVLIPRAETEELVFYIFESINDMDAPLQILDIGTGSGCIPITLKSRLNNAQILGIDISEEAIHLAKTNAMLNQHFVDFETLDFLDPTQRKRIENKTYDIIVSNPPYIPRSEKSKMDSSVLAYEPELALYTESPHGQDFYSEIADFALMNLKPNGVVFCELNEFRARESQSIFKQKGFKSVIIIDDMQGKSRILKAKL